MMVSTNNHTKPMNECVFFKHDLRAAGLPTEDIDGSEFESTLVDEDEREWYVLEVLEPCQVQTFIKLMDDCWKPTGTVSKTNYDSDDDDLYSQQVSSFRYSQHYYITHPEMYCEHY